MVVAEGHKGTVAEPSVTIHEDRQKEGVSNLASDDVPGVGSDGPGGAVDGPPAQEESQPVEDGEVATISESNGESRLPYVFFCSPSFHDDLGWLGPTGCYGAVRE